jgi:hypothetical protein
MDQDPDVIIEHDPLPPIPDIDEELRCRFVGCRDLRFHTFAAYWDHLRQHKSLIGGS